MFRINCPHCSCELEVQKDWQGMQTSCPVCGKDFIIPMLTVPKKKSPLLLIIIIAAAVVAAVVLLIILLSGRNSSRDTGSVSGESAEISEKSASVQTEQTASIQTEKVPSVQSGDILKRKNIETKIRETVEETKLKHALSAESPDIKELTALVRQVPHPEIYEKSLLEEFDRQFGKAASHEVKMQLLEAVSVLGWKSVEERRVRFYDSIGQELHNAIESFDFAVIKQLYPLALKTGHPRLGQAKIILDAEKVLLRRNPQEIREFIDKCSDSYIKQRLQNLVAGNFRQQATQLISGIRRELARGNLPVAERMFKELESIAPDNEETCQLRKQLAEIRRSEASSSAPGTPGMSGRRRRPDSRGRNGRPNMHGRGRMPVHIQLNRACMMGAREEVIQLMAQKPDLHQVMKITDSATGTTRSSTVFNNLLSRGKSLSGSRRDAFRGCIIVILESGFKPNAEEMQVIREHYPELIQFIR